MGEVPGASCLLSYLTRKAGVRVPYFLATGTQDRVASFAPILPVTQQQQVFSLLQQLFQGDEADLCVELDAGNGEVTLAVGETRLLSSPFAELNALCSTQQSALESSSTSTSEVVAATKTRVARLRRPKPTPSPIAYPEVPSFNPEQWMQMRERLRQVEKFHDFCECFLEAINLPAREWHVQDAQGKVCKIELAGKFVVEGRAQSWVKARTRAAMEVMGRLDRPLCEEWLATHSDYLLHHFFS